MVITMTCNNCKYNKEEIRDLHRTVDNIDWESIKRKFHKAIDDTQLISTKITQRTLKNIQDIEALYTLVIEDNTKLTDEEIDCLFEEYIEIKESEEEVDKERIDHILSLFKYNNIEIVDEGYRSWTVKYSE